MSLLKATDFWRPRQQYYANDRIKTLLLQDDKFYICNETHTSGPTFDASKFTLVAGGGSSGGGSLEPSGVWDIANSTTAGPIVDVVAQLSIGYDATVSNNIVTNSGFGVYPLGGGFNGYGAEHANFLVNDFSTTKWLTLANAPNSYQFFVIYKDDNINPITDIMQKLFLNDFDINVEFIAGLVGILGNPQVFIYHNISLGNMSSTPLTTTSNNDISFGLNLSTGNLTLDNITDITDFTIPTSFFDGATNLKLFVGGVVGGPISTNSVSLLFPDQVNKPPMLVSQQSFDVIPPVGAVDGTMWRITSNGFYDSVQLGIDDYVIFYNNLLSIVPIFNSFEELDALNQAINNISVQLDGLLSLQERAIIRGVIDWVTDVPTTPSLGDTFLTDNNPPGILSPNFLYVYDGTQWVELNQPPGSIFNVSSYNIQIKYVSGPGRLEKRYVKRLIGTQNGFNPLIDMLFDSSNNSWFIVNNVRSAGYLTATNITNQLYCLLNDHSDYMIDLIDSFTSYDCILINSDIDVLFSIEPTMLYFRNSTATDITLNLGSSIPMKVCGKLETKALIIPANGNLCLSARTIVKDEIFSSYTLLEYVSGDYISSINYSLLDVGNFAGTNNNITDFYLDVDTADPFMLSVTVDTLTPGKVYNVFYNVTVPNSNIIFRLTDGSTNHDTTLSVLTTNKHNVIRFNGSSLGVY